MCGVYTIWCRGWCTAVAGNSGNGESEVHTGTAAMWPSRLSAGPTQRAKITMISCIAGSSSSFGSTYFCLFLSIIDVFFQLGFTWFQYRNPQYLAPGENRGVLHVFLFFVFSCFLVLPSLLQLTKLARGIPSATFWTNNVVMGCLRPPPRYTWCHYYIARTGFIQN